MTRNAAILMAVAALIAVYMFLIEPLQGKRAEIREQLATERETLMKQERFIKRVKDGSAALKKSVDELQRLEQYMIRERDLPLASARLQAKVQDLAASASLTVTSIKPLTPIKHEHYSTVPIHVECSGNMEQFSKFLNLLDNTWELVEVEKLSVSVSPDGTLKIRAQLGGLVKT